MQTLSETPVRPQGGRILLYFNFTLCLVLFTAGAFGVFPLLWARSCMILAVAIGVVTAVAPFVMRIAHVAGAVDHPGGRRIHTQSTPRWGGLAVGFSVFVALVLFSRYYMPNLRALLAGSMLVLIVGALDDVQPVRASVKLLAQIAACFLLITDGVVVTIFPPTVWGIPLRWLVTFLWVVGITNAVNFLDGMDGLVSGWCIAVCLVYCVLAFLLGRPMLAYCAAALLGGALGFMAFNFKPARLFLGDCGSTFIGFFLAALSVRGSWSDGNPLVSFCIPVLVLSVPIYDMVFTTVERIATGKVRSFRGWLEYTGRDHLHHRLEALGLSRGQVVLVICFLSLAVGMSAVVLYEAKTYAGIMLIIQAIFIYAVFALLELLGRRKAR